MILAEQLEVQISIEPLFRRLEAYLAPYLMAERHSIPPVCLM